jgi:PadR family transcriptional regulator
MGMRMTLQAQAILNVMLDDPAGRYYGLELAKAAGLASGSLYPLLAKLEREGVLTSSWEHIDQHEAGRPRRRYYMFTTDGAALARQELAATRQRLAPGRARATRPGLAGSQ